MEIIVFMMPSTKDKHGVTKKKKKRALTRTWEFQRLTCYHAISAAIQKFVPQKEDIKKMLL